MRKLLLLGVLLASAAGLTLLVVIPRAVVFATPYPITASPADVGLDYKDIVLQPADLPLQLAGWWMPAVNARASLVFIHGGSSNRHSSYFSALQFYRAMVDAGVSVVAIDLRNHGASGKDARGIQFGLTEQADALAAIRWARVKTPGLPVFGMGISMGGATLIYAAAAGATLDGLILLDPLLDGRSAFSNAVNAESGLPVALLQPAAVAAESFYGLPARDQQALDIGKTLQLPTLLIQDPTDPVTLAVFAQDLASANGNVSLWLAPAADAQDPRLAWKRRWGSHVGAFALFPEQTLAQILGFIDSGGGSGTIQ